ncbi:MAG: biopolymer transporter ExbD [Pyrinomonadaceae bacterium]|nr:biopolymer transporter ExbD [Pyrinomonadaceae bacterium]
MDNKPNVNVTPLIDVLLVLLIIFMVVSPIKPTDFKAKIPSEAKETAAANPHPDTLIVAINADSTLRLNTENDVGSVENADKLIARLNEIFRERRENHAYAEDKALRNDLSEDEKTQKTVFIKAPRFLDYGSVVKIVDAVKIAGASPISLQIDDLN